MLAPVAVASLADAPPPTAFVEVEGICVEEDRSDPNAVAWEVVPMEYCTGA